SAVRAFPRCSSPVGLGAKRVTTRPGGRGGALALVLMTPCYGKLIDLNKAPPAQVAARICRRRMCWTSQAKWRIDAHQVPDADQLARGPAVHHALARRGVLRRGPGSPGAGHLEPRGGGV